MQRIGRLAGASERRSAIGIRAVILALALGAALFALIAGYDHARRLDELVGAALLAIGAGATALLFPVLDAATYGSDLAPLIAFVGCDGSGKSTLSADLVAEVSRDRSAQTCYLGLGSGAIGARIKQLPLLGEVVERRLARKADQTRTTGEKIPGLGTALVVYLFSLVRLRRFRRMLRLRRAGVTVFTDRYPQIEVGGFYDGPGLAAAQPGSQLVALLARREQRIYRWMASFQPDVVIRLNVDTETAHARKPDHGYELLARKVGVTPRLRFNGARIVDIDSREPYDAVRAKAAGVVRTTLASRAAA